MKLSTAIAEYLLGHQIANHSPATLRYYLQNLQWFCDFLGNPDIGSVTLCTARSYVIHLQQRQTSSTSLQTYVRAVRGFLTWCHGEGYIAEDISAKLKLPKATRKTIDILTDEEVRRLLDCIDTRSFIGLRDMIVVLLMLDSGLRLSEVLRQTYGKIHLESGYLIAHGKGDKERFVPLGLNCRRYLLKYLARLPNLEPQTQIVVKDTLTAATYDTIRQLFKRLKVRANIPRLHPHLLRHPNVKTATRQNLHKFSSYFCAKSPKALIRVNSRFDTVLHHSHLPTRKVAELPHHFDLLPRENLYLVNQRFD